MERIKQILYKLSFILMLMFSPVSVLADTGEQVLTPVDSNDFGSITVQLQDTEKNNPKGNVKLSLAKIADVVQGEFILCNKFSSSGVDLNAISNANEVENAVERLMKFVTPEKEMITNDKGYAKAEDLAVGVYVIYATDRAKYAEITPSIVSIPTYDEYIGVMDYEVDVLPKYTLLKPGKITTSMPGHISELLSGSFQTGIENHALKYTVISICLFIAAVVLLGFFRKKKVINK